MITTIVLLLWGIMNEKFTDIENVYLLWFLTLIVGVIQDFALIKWLRKSSN